MKGITLMSLRDGLSLPMVIRGEVRVKEVEKENGSKSPSYHS